MSSYVNANSSFEYSVSNSLPSGEKYDPEQWLHDLARFTEALSCALIPALDEGKVSDAVLRVERTMADLHSWVEIGNDADLKKKVASGVSEALKSICNLASCIDGVPTSRLAMITRVLDVGEALLLCHKLIKYQLVQSCCRFL